MYEELTDPKKLRKTGEFSPSAYTGVSMGISSSLEKVWGKSCSLNTGERLGSVGKSMYNGDLMGNLIPYEIV